MEDFKIYSRIYMHLTLALLLVVVSIILFTVPLFGPETALFMIPLGGTSIGLTWAIFGIYDALAQRHALGYTIEKPKSNYKRDLRRMRRERSKIIRELYSNLGWGNLHASSQIKLERIDRQIKNHTEGIEEEDRPRGRYNW